MKGASKVLEEWEQCINTQNVECILSLYDKNAVLWGTFSTILRDNNNLIKEYFIQLFSKDKLAVKFKESKNRIYSNTFILSGSYDFSYEDQGLKIIPARYTFVIHKFSENNYKIIEHHSSVMPE